MICSCRDESPLELQPVPLARKPRIPRARTTAPIPPPAGRPQSARANRTPAAVQRRRLESDEPSSPASCSLIRQQSRKDMTGSKRRRPTTDRIRRGGCGNARSMLRTVVTWRHAQAVAWNQGLVPCKPTSKTRPLPSLLWQRTARQFVPLCNAVQASGRSGTFAYTRLGPSKRRATNTPLR